jgi:hypothetical protein
MVDVSVAALAKMASDKSTSLPTLVEIDALTDTMNSGNYSKYIAVKAKQVELLGILATSLLDEQLEKRRR